MFLERYCRIPFEDLYVIAKSQPRDAKGREAESLKLESHQAMLRAHHAS
jgi:hypothetical protein